MTQQPSNQQINFKTLGLGIVIGAIGVSVGYLIKSKWFRKKQFKVVPKFTNKKESTLTQAQQAVLDSQQLIRLQQYFGKQKLKKLRDSKVIVFGLGGVGSHVVNMLVRTGVQHLKIIDFDRVSLSSLSRHAYAVREDVGTPKTDCMKKYIHKIFPKTQVETVDEYVNKQNVDKLLQDCDYVIDCIDNIDAKVELVKACNRRNIRIIISGGAGMKNDATQIQIRDLADSKNDELLTSLRRRLNKVGLRKGIKCVFSRQQATKQLLPLNQAQQQDPNQYRVFDNYRVRIVPVLGTMPALIGQAIASYVLCQLCDQPYEPFQADEIKVTHYAKIFSRLASDQNKLGIKQDDLQVDIEDVYLLMRYIYKWRCIVTDKESKQYYLARYNKEQSANVFNLVPMCKQAYDKHIQAGSLEQMKYSQDIHERFQNGCEQIRKLKQKRGFAIVR